MYILIYPSHITRDLCQKVLKIREVKNCPLIPCNESYGTITLFLLALRETPILKLPGSSEHGKEKQCKSTQICKPASNNLFLIRD